MLGEVGSENLRVAFDTGVRTIREAADGCTKLIESKVVGLEGSAYLRFVPPSKRTQTCNTESHWLAREHRRGGGCSSSKKIKA